MTFDDQVKEFERGLLEREIIKRRGSQASIVRALKISRTSLSLKITEYGLRPLLKLERSKRIEANRIKHLKASDRAAVLATGIFDSPWLPRPSFRPLDETESERQQDIERLSDAMAARVDGSIER